MPTVWQSASFAMVYAWQDNGINSPPVAGLNEREFAGDSSDMT